MNSAPEQAMRPRTALQHQFPRTFRPATERAGLLLRACSHYPRSDRPLFVAGYNELTRLDLNGGKILEVCCGFGELAREMARAYSEAEMVGMDRYPDAGRAIVE